MARRSDNVDSVDESLPQQISDKWNKHTPFRVRLMRKKKALPKSVTPDEVTGVVVKCEPYSSNGMPPGIRLLTVCRDPLHNIPASEWIQSEDVDEAKVAANVHLHRGTEKVGSIVHIIPKNERPTCIMGLATVSNTWYYLAASESISANSRPNASCYVMCEIETAPDVWVWLNTAFPPDVRACKKKAAVRDWLNGKHDDNLPNPAAFDSAWVAEQQRVFDQLGGVVDTERAEGRRFLWGRNVGKTRAVPPVASPSSKRRKVHQNANSAFIRSQTDNHSDNHVYTSGARFRIKKRGRSKHSDSDSDEDPEWSPGPVARKKRRLTETTAKKIKVKSRGPVKKRPYEKLSTASMEEDDDIDEDDEKKTAENKDDVAVAFFARTCPPPRRKLVSFSSLPPSSFSCVAFPVSSASTSSGSASSSSSFSTFVPISVPPV